MRYYCCGMIRSGSTWQYNIVKEILEQKRQVEVIGFFAKEEDLAIEIGSKDNFLAKFHFASPSAIEDVKKNTGKAIYIHRKLEDIAVSFMNMKQKSLRWVIENNYLDNAWKNFNIWTSQPGVLVQQYETVMANPFLAIKEIAGYLGVQMSDEEIQSIEHKNNLESQKKFIAQMPGSTPLEKRFRIIRKKIGGWMHPLIGKKRTKFIASLFKTGGAIPYDKNKLLHNEHINTGEVDYWKKALSPKDQKFISEYVENLKRSGNTGQ